MSTSHQLCHLDPLSTAPVTVPMDPTNYESHSGNEQPIPGLSWSDSTFCKCLSRQYVSIKASVVMCTSSLEGLIGC